MKKVKTNSGVGRVSTSNNNASSSQTNKHKHNASNTSAISNASNSSHNNPLSDTEEDDIDVHAVQEQSQKDGGRTVRFNSTDSSAEDVDMNGDDLTTPDASVAITSSSDVDAIPFPRLSETRVPDIIPQITRHLSYTTKEAATPGKFSQKQKPTRPLQVICKFRPLLEDELQEGLPATLVKQYKLQSSALEVPYTIDTVNHKIQVVAPVYTNNYKTGAKSATYEFTRVLPLEISQQQTYEVCCSELVHTFIKGTNALIFAYGVTKSGKTYTMEGTGEEPGILTRALTDVFSGLQSSSAFLPKDLIVKCSYLEVYDNLVYDLLPAASTDMSLAPDTVHKKGAKGKKNVKYDNSSLEMKDKRPTLLLRNQRNDATNDDEFYVDGLCEYTVETLQQAQSLFVQGQFNRRTGATRLNEASSRSHSVFCIKLVHQSHNRTTNKLIERTFSKMSIVDLAGAERNKRANNQGNAMKEANSINEALSALGNCLRIMIENQSKPKGKREMVPFRNSAITQLFSDSLRGWGNTVMIANASSSPLDFDETIQALKYASVAKDIKIEAKVNTHQYMQQQSTTKHRPSNKRKGSVVQLNEREEEDVLDQVQEEAEEDEALEEDDDANIDESAEAAEPAKQPTMDDLWDEIFDLREALTAQNVNYTKQLQQHDERWSADLEVAIRTATERSEQRMNARIAADNKLAERKLANKCKELELATARVSDLEEQLDETITENEELQDKVAASSSATRLSVPKPQAVRVSKTDQYQALHNKCMTLERELTSYVEEIETLKTSLIDMTTQRDEAEQKHKLSEKSLRTSKSQYDALHSEHQTTNTKLDGVRRENAKLEQSLNDAEQTVERLQAELEAAKQFAKSSKKADALQAQVDELQTQHKRQSVLADTQQRENSRLESELVAAHDEVTALKAELAQKAAKYAELEKENEEIRAKQTAATTNTRNSKLQDQQARSQLEALARREVDLQKQVKSRDKELTSLREQYAEAKQQLALMSELHSTQIQHKEVQLDELSAQVEQMQQQRIELPAGVQQYVDQVAANSNSDATGEKKKKRSKTRKSDEQNNNIALETDMNVIVASVSDSTAATADKPSKKRTSKRTSNQHVPAKPEVVAEEDEQVEEEEAMLPVDEPMMEDVIEENEAEAEHTSTLLNTTDDLTAMLGLGPVKKAATKSAEVDNKSSRSKAAPSEEQRRVDELSKEEARKATKRAKDDAAQRQKDAKKLLKQKQKEYQTEQSSDPFAFTESPLLPKAAVNKPAKASKYTAAVNVPAFDDEDDEAEASFSQDTENRPEVSNVAAKSNSRKKLASKIEPAVAVVTEHKTSKAAPTPLIKRLRSALR